MPRLVRIRLRDTRGEPDNSLAELIVGGEHGKCPCRRAVATTTAASSAAISVHEKLRNGKVAKARQGLEHCGGDVLEVRRTDSQAPHSANHGLQMATTKSASISLT